MAPSPAWLLKSEPGTYGIDDLERDGRTPWDGVRNYQARNFMRDDMRPGDPVLFYHSNASPPGVVGVARVASEPYPDPTQFDPESRYFDPKATVENPRWQLVDVAFERRLPRTVAISELKADPCLATMQVARRGNRLSVTPVTREQFERVVALAERPANGAAGAAGGTVDHGRRPS